MHTVAIIPLQNCIKDLQFSCERDLCELNSCYEGITKCPPVNFTILEETYMNYVLHFILINVLFKCV